MAERMIPVPESLIEALRDAHGGPDLDDAAGALIEMLPDSYTSALPSQPEQSAEPECTCYPAPERLHTTHYGATDPASMREPNPDCPVHFPAAPPSITDMAPGTTCDYCEGRGYDFEDDGLSQSAGSCWKCHGTGRVAVDINAMSPGTTFVEAIRWEVRRDSGGFTYALRDGTSRYPETFDPSTIRDVTPPKDGLVASSR